MSVRAPRVAVRRTAALLAILACVPVLTGCGATPSEPGASGTIEGTGEVFSEVRELEPFTRVSVAAGMKVIVGEAAAQEVTVSAQQNLLPAIETVVTDGQLIVTIAAPGVTATQPMSLTLRMTEVDSVALSGGCVGFVEHTGDDLNLDVSGGSEVTAIGDTTGLALTATTGSHAKLGELVAADAAIDVNDGSAAVLTVTGALTGTADGGSTITLTTAPASEQVELLSGATIQHS
jgi:hypothetical protein